MENIQIDVPFNDDLKYISQYYKLFNNKVILYKLGLIKREEINIEENFIKLSPKHSLEIANLFISDQRQLAIKNDKQYYLKRVQRHTTEYFFYILKQFFPDLLILNYFVFRLELNDNKNLNLNNFVLSKGYFGKISLAYFNIVIKSILDKHISQYEEFVGKIICNNILIKYNSNLVYTYCRLTIDNDKNLLLIEKKSNARTLKQLIKHNKLSFKNLKEIYYQVILNLYILKKEYCFSHNDLHIENILIIEKDNYEFNCELDNIIYGIKNPKYIPFIIDYGMASFYYNNKFYLPPLKNNLDFYFHNIDNDIYKFSIFLLFYCDKYNSNKDFIQFLYNILIEYSFISASLETIKNNFKDFSFKRNINVNTSNFNIFLNLLKSLELKKIKKEKTGTLNVTIKNKTKTLDALISLNVKTFECLSYIKDFLDREDFIFFIEEYKYYEKYEKDEQINKFINVNTDLDLDIIEEVSLIYKKEMGREIFDRKLFEKWFSNSKDVFFYFFELECNENVKLKCGYIAFKKKDEAYYIEFYLIPLVTGKKLGKYFFNKALEKFIKELPITLRASIYNFNDQSINFFKKLEFNLISKNKSVSLLEKKIF